MTGTAFVGRDVELGRLQSALDLSLSGKGQVVLVSGQPGSGKTALCRAFLARAVASHPELLVATGSGNAQTGVSDPYLPFREALAGLTTGSTEQGEAGGAPPESQVSGTSRTVMARTIQVLVDVAPDLVGAFVPGAKLIGALGKAVATKVGWMDQLDELAERADRAGTLAAIADQKRIFEQFWSFLERLSAHAPIALLIDDLHWADNASIALFFHIARHLGSSRFLLIGSYRPSEVAMGRDGGRHPLDPVINELLRYFGDITVDLDRSIEERGREFVDHLIDSEFNCLDAVFRRDLFSRTAGHPLFTVETLRNLQERGDLLQDAAGCWNLASQLDWQNLPARVEGVIAERVARLDETAHAMLNAASVEGEQFTAEVVARVEQKADRDVVRLLSDDIARHHRLVSSLGLLQLDQRRLSLYRFSHNMIQQYLYLGLDPVERAYLHQDVGTALEALYGAKAQEVAAPLSRHFEEAGMPAKAAAYRLQAGDAAKRVSAFQDAEDHLVRGLQLIELLPQGAERIALEIGLRASLGAALIARRGYGAAEVLRNIEQARLLCTQLGDPPQVLPVLFGLLTVKFVKSDLSYCLRESEALEALAERSGEGGFQTGARMVRGASMMYLGRHTEAQQLLETAVANYDAVKYRDQVFLVGLDPLSTTLSYLSWVQWFRGAVDQAVITGGRALVAAESLFHPYSAGLAACFAATLCQLISKWDESLAHAARGIRIGEERGFPIWTAMGRMLRGHARSERGELEEGLQDVTLGLRGWDDAGATLARPYYQARLAETYLAVRRRDEGLSILDVATREAVQKEQAWWLPEHYRLRAQLLQLEPGNDAEAEQSLDAGLALAREHGALSLELRCAMGLHHLLVAAGRAAEGRDRLRAVYDRFTEGFDSAELVLAREALA